MLTTRDIIELVRNPDVSLKVGLYEIERFQHFRMVAFYVMGAVVSAQEIGAVQIPGNNVTLVGISSNEFLIYFRQPLVWPEFAKICTLRNISKDTAELKRIIGDLWKSNRWRVHKLEDNTGRFTRHPTSLSTIDEAERDGNVSNFHEDEKSDDDES